MYNFLHAKTKKLCLKFLKTFLTKLLIFFTHNFDLILLHILPTFILIIYSNSE